MDTVEDKGIVVSRTNPGFRTLFEIGTTSEGSDVVLIQERPPDRLDQEDSPT